MAHTVTIFLLCGIFCSFKRSIWGHSSNLDPSGAAAYEILGNILGAQLTLIHFLVCVPSCASAYEILGNILGAQFTLKHFLACVPSCDIANVGLRDIHGCKAHTELLTAHTGDILGAQITLKHFLPCVSSWNFANIIFGGWSIGHSSHCNDFPLVCHHVQLQTK